MITELGGYCASMTEYTTLVSRMSGADNVATDTDVGEILTTDGLVRVHVKVTIEAGTIDQLVECKPHYAIEKTAHMTFEKGAVTTSHFDDEPLALSYADHNLKATGN